MNGYTHCFLPKYICHGFYFRQLAASMDEPLVVIMRLRLDPLTDLGLQLLDRCSNRQVWKREWAMGAQRRRDDMKRKGLWRWRVIVASYRGRHVDYEADDKLTSEL
jgi:hypothetical protein